MSVIGERGVDTVFVYFGALNTSKDLKKVAAGISQVLEPGGVAILTFVNRWYLFDILWNALLLRPRKSLARLGEIWTVTARQEACLHAVIPPARLGEASSRI